MSTCIAEEEEEVVPRLYDTMFIWRTVLVVLMALSAVGGGLVALLDYGLQPVMAQQIKKTYNF